MSDEFCRCACSGCKGCIGHEPTGTGPGEEIVAWLHGLEHGVRKLAANRILCGPEEREIMQHRLGLYDGVAEDIRRKWPALFAAKAVA
jgi:hypothetical protein